MRKNQNGTNRQSGIALLLTLLILLVLSSLAAAMIFVTETETWSSSNYKSMLQARYAAEAGAQNTLNWLLYTYTIPTSISAFDLTKYPVQDSATHNTIVLSATSSSAMTLSMAGASANYPTAANTGLSPTVSSAFSSALKDASVPGVGTAASYEVTATLLSMKQSVSFLGTGAPLQTWQITSQGNVAGIRNAQVQVVMRIERSGTPNFIYGVAGDGTTCPDVNFTGGTMDAWNSAAGTYTATHQNSGGNIGTNGNVTLEAVA